MTTSDIVQQTPNHCRWRPKAFSGLVVTLAVFENVESFQQIIPSQNRDFTLPRETAYTNLPDCLYFKECEKWWELWNYLFLLLYLYIF